MKTLIAAVVVLLAVSAARAEDPTQALARGKLEADLGHHGVAAEAFVSVSSSPQATAPQRWEAQVRLAVARRDAGDAKGSVAAFEEAFRSYGKDPEALRFLILAAGGAIPGNSVGRRCGGRSRSTWTDATPTGRCSASGGLESRPASARAPARRSASISRTAISRRPSVCSPTSQG